VKLHYVVISILIVSLISLGAINYVNDMKDAYGESVDLTGLNKTQARLEEQQASAMSLSDEITSFKLETVVDFFNIPYKMIKIGWKAGKTMFGSWSTVGAMIEETGKGISDNGIPLPEWLIPSIVAIFIMLLIALIIYGFFKWKFQD